MQKWPKLTELLPLIGAGLSHVGHYQTRSRGTVCGSIAHSDPSSEMPLCLATLEGNVVPQSVKLPLAIVEDPNFKEGQDFFPDQSDNFFVGNSFPTCGINFTAQEIMGQTKENK